MRVLVTGGAGLLETIAWQGNLKAATSTTEGR
jgi:hypothetical protein